MIMELNSVDHKSSKSNVPLLSRSDSCMSIGAFRPSLAWLFNHVRREDQENLSKEDLKHLLGATVNSAQLDEAFENLDLDKDGEISLDEFIAGFAKFWKEAPHTPGAENMSFLFPTGSKCGVDHYESQEMAPSPRLKECLTTLSSHNRHSIEHLWRNLSEQNPDLLADFEEFVAEVASEVQFAQRALDNQRRAIKKEVHELDKEIESRLTDAQTTLHLKTNLVKEQVRAKLERRLMDKEGELMFIRSQLSELSNRLDACTCLILQLEEEVLDTQRLHIELQDEIQALHQEKSELHERLQESEKKLEESQSTVTTIQSKALLEVEAQQEHLRDHEELLLKQKREYEASIAKLREQLAMYTQQSPDESQLPTTGINVTPDLLATSQPRYLSRGSLKDEIVQRDGIASPLLLNKQGLESSSFRERTHTFIHNQPWIEKNLKKLSNLTMSLPNLADIDDLNSTKQPVYIPVYVGAEGNPMFNDKESFPPQKEVNNDELKEGHVVNHLTPIGGDHWSGSISPSSDSSSLPSVPDHPLRTLQDREKQQLSQPIEFIEKLKDPPDYVFKILVVGESFVGKSSYLDRMCNNTFSQHYSSTVGVDFHSKALRTEDKKVVSLQLWDTAGQERYKAVTKSYYRGANGVILMYDVSQEETFLSVKSWIHAIHNNAGNTPPAAMVLVGNKIDLEETGEREVLTETGENFAKTHGAEFIETSAKTGYNVANSLLMLVRAIKDQADGLYKQLKNVEPLQPQDQTVSLNESPEHKKDGCMCSK